MTVRLWTSNYFAPFFEFDLTEEVSKAYRFAPTKRPVENVGNVNDHIHKEPFTVTSNGFVAVTPISPRNYQPIPSTDPAVMATLQKQLEETALKRDLVNIACDVYTGPAAITALQFSKGVSDGYSLRCSISLAEIEIATPLTTQINPSKLRAKVKPRGPTKGGQKATPQQVAAQNRKDFLIKQSKLSRAFGG